MPRFGPPWQVSTSVSGVPDGGGTITTGGNVPPVTSPPGVPLPVDTDTLARVVTALRFMGVDPAWFDPDPCTVEALTAWK